jgi:peroxin-14
MRDTKSATRRQEDETDRLRDEMKSVNDVIPKSMSANKEFTDNRLREISNEVKRLKAHLNQRMSSTPAVPPAASSTGTYLQSTNGNTTAPSPAAPNTPVADTVAKENGDAKAAASEDASPASKKDYLSSLGGRSSPFGSGMPASKASIPSWQKASASGNSGSGSQQEAGGSS